MSENEHTNQKVCILLNVYLSIVFGKWLNIYQTQFENKHS